LFGECFQVAAVFKDLNLLSQVLPLFEDAAIIPRLARLIPRADWAFIRWTIHCAHDFTQPYCSRRTGYNDTAS
jgi:hypothetical protein